MQNISYTIHDRNTQSRILAPFILFALAVHLVFFIIFQQPITHDDNHEKQANIIHLQVATQRKTAMPAPKKVTSLPPPPIVSKPSAVKATTPPPPIVSKPSAVKATTPIHKPKSQPQNNIEAPSTKPASPQEIAPKQDNSQLLLSQYLTTVKNKIQKQQRYPSAARRRRLQGTVEVSFQWDASGKLISHSIKRSSGQKILDGAAIQMIKRSSPLPPIPPVLKRQLISASESISFSPS